MEAAISLKTLWRGDYVGVSKRRHVTQEFSITSALGRNQGGIRVNELNFAEFLLQL